MPKKQVRYHRFLKNYVFFSNSIEFRIHSSKSLERWKNVQSFQLNQLVNGKYYFSQDVKEILLLNYDLWSKWLYEVENYCIEINGMCQTNCTSTDKSNEKCKSRSGETKVIDENIEFVDVLVDKVTEEFNHVVFKNQKCFKKELLVAWEKQHAASIRHMKEEMKLLVNASLPFFFAILVDLISKVLQHALIEIHEIENLIAFRNGKTKDCPFLVVDAFDKKNLNNPNVYSIKERVINYQEKFNLTEVCLINYTDDPIPAKVVNEIEDQGVTVNFRLSSRINETD